MQAEMKSFLDAFRPTSHPISDESLSERGSRYLAIYRNPEQLNPGKSRMELSCIRRNARQNLRRLLQKHPFVFDKLRAEYSVELSQGSSHE
ncbi:MAG TPA: hypothetical protein VHX37_11335 [Acidobacteriaceae bacterium]|jgi:hypothetical protein|nr:hypothetical protein [Acidobacteriaceae bacterium]